MGGGGCEEGEREEEGGLLERFRSETAVCVVGLFWGGAKVKILRGAAKLFLLLMI